MTAVAGDDIAIPAETAASLQDVEDWVLAEGKAMRLAQLIAGFCCRLTEAGVPILRCTVHIRQLHPQYYSRAFTWLRGEAAASETPREHGIEKTATYLDSPLFIVYERGEDVRRRLHEPATPRDFPILADLDEMGATDYVAIGLPFRRGVGQAVTLATDQPGGFSNANLALVRAALPAFSAVTELINLERMSQVVLQTYLGPSTGQRVVEGRIRRGDVSRIRAVLMFSDLRDFTRLSESLPGTTVIDLLNAYFETIAEPLTEAGGEILKFVGDGMLAILPVEGDDEAGLRSACDTALTAAITANTALSELNAGRSEPLASGMALHVGDVLYGNIGTKDRLDFTVIGPAVNLVSRIEHVCREAELPVALSAAFAEAVSAPVRSLGRFDLQGIAEPQEIFAPA